MELVDHFICAQNTAFYDIEKWGCFLPRRNGFFSRDRNKTHPYLLQNVIETRAGQ